MVKEVNSEDLKLKKQKSQQRKENPELESALVGNTKLEEREDNFTIRILINKLYRYVLLHKIYFNLV